MTEQEKKYTKAQIIIEFPFLAYKAYAYGWENLLNSSGQVKK